MFSNGVSLSDIAAVTGNNRSNDGMWGDGAWWIVILLIFGWGGFGNNGFGGNTGSAYTDSAIQRGFDNQAVISKLDGITNGLCDGFYAQNTALMNGFHGVDNAICNLGYQTQQSFNNTNVALMQGQNALQTQIANCCCENREGQAQIRYDMATQACETRQAIADSTRQVLDFLTQDKIATLTAENNDLRRAASQDRQNALLTTAMTAQTNQIIDAVRPTPIPSFPASNLYGYAYNGCGCNTGCGC